MFWCSLSTTRTKSLLQAVLSKYTCVKPVSYTYSTLGYSCLGTWHGLLTTCFSQHFSRVLHACSMPPTLFPWALLQLSCPNCQHHAFSNSKISYAILVWNPGTWNNEQLKRNTPQFWVFSFQTEWKELQPVVTPQVNCFLASYPLVRKPDTKS